MSIVLKPKTYGPVTATASENAAVRCMGESGQQVLVGSMAGSNASSPAELLLAALASCIALSLDMAAASLKYSIANVNVHVVAHKASTLPHRIARFRIEISVTTEPDTDTALLLRKTKELCTISNSLSADIQLVHAQP